MSKAVLLSVRPKHCHHITIKDKKIEIRKRIPVELKTPFKVYLYCTKGSKHEAFTVDKYGNSSLFHCCDYNTAIPVGCEIANGKVFGEFTCKRIYEYKHEYATGGGYISATEEDTLHLLKWARLSPQELRAYLGKHNGIFYAMHIAKLVIYDKPKELREFEGLRQTKFGYEPIKLTRPPQSWCYVEEITNDC